MLLLARRNEAVQAELRELSEGEIILGQPAAARALVKRAERGRVDAIKLMFEISGLHNPKVLHDHEHSGEITINFKSVGRPQPVLDEETVVDADVVE
jgi:hypothetical protein